MRIILCAALLLSQPTPQTAGERYKSVRVLSDIPATQVIEVMSVIAGSLGVTCSLCHTDAFASDEKPNKEKARQMILMTRRIDQEFGGHGTITCNTCHQGRAVPPPVSLVANAGWNQPVAAAPDALPALDTVLERYLAASGGRAAVERIASRPVTGTVSRNNGRVAPVSGTYSIGPSAASVDTRLSYPPEGNTEWPVLLSRAARMSDIYPAMTVTGRVTIAGKPAVVVKATTRSGTEQQLFFDESSGLLLKRHSEKPTVLGPLPEEFDFEDYREVDGARVPHRIHWSRADYRVTFIIEGLK
jgi:hypothetical protein